MRRSIRTYCKDETGAVAGIYAVALIGLIAIGGVGFDYARMAGMDSELQNGADQAALAAATQLDENDGACARADAAGIGLLSNITLLSNVDPDDGSIARNEVTVNSGTGALTGNDQCGNRGYIKFYSSYTNPATNTIATTDETAAFVEVAVDSRTARYAFTPIVGAIFATMSARAVAGVSSSFCNVPPLMICDPDPGNVLPVAQRFTKGIGIQVTSHGGGAWSPGNFGFLEVGATKLEDLIQSLAFDTVPLNCAKDEGTKPETGNAQNLYRAINTRFDIYDFATSTGGAALADCNSGRCPAALINTKDVIRTTGTSGNNACKLHNQGWKLPSDNEQFWPRPTSAGTYSSLQLWNNSTHTPTITAMGFPRDLCHYTSWNAGHPNKCGTDANNRFGNANWARGDYFQRNHNGKALPANASTITRYETYLWENSSAANKPSELNGQEVDPVCSNKNGATAAIGRRKLTVAIVTNCSSLSGSSTPVEIGDWVDMFLVEPIIDARGNGSLSDGVYMEVIEVNDLGSGSVAGGPVRKDKPYLIE